MSKTRSRTFYPLERYAASHHTTLRAAALFVLALGACAPEDDKYGRTVPVDKVDDNDTAIDPDDGSDCPRFDANYRDGFKSCAADSDCEVVRYAARCNSLRVYAIASAELDAFNECAPESPCESPTAGRAEDGRSIGDVEALSDVQSRCIDGMCEARVESRSCGASGEVCNAAEICVSSLNDAGSVDYQCLPNPCLGETLDCSCAAAVCKGGGRPRLCTMEQIDDADVYCKAERR